MIGTVRIYQGYDDKPILEEANLIVDGFKEHIVDIMTRVPAPSAVIGDVSSSYSTSNFTVQAMSFSPNESNFDRIHSLGVASGVVNGSSTSSLDPQDGQAWSYREDISNYQFSSVNWSGTKASNSILANSTFTDTINFFKNTRFKDYNIDTTLDGYVINEYLSLYDLPNWEVQSELRYNPSALYEFFDSYEYGSCARYDMSALRPEVSSIYSTLSGTEASSTFAEPDDGILYIRSFAPSSTGGDSSGAVVLTQTAAGYTSSMEPWVSIEDETALDVVAEISFQFSSTEGEDGAQIHVEAKDTFTGDYYNFETSPGGNRHSWGGEGSALVVDASAGLSGTVSKFINIPKERVKHPLEISYSFYSKTDSDILKCYFWNPGFRVIDNWYFGNIWTNGDIATVSGNDYRSSGLYINLSAAPTAIESTDLSNVTFVTQLANMVPTKVYSYNIFTDRNTAADPTDRLYGSIVKRYTSNMTEKGRYNLLTQPQASALNETRLGHQSYAVSPELNRSASLTKYDGMAKDVKASDLCLEISSSVSGGFSCSADRSFILKGEVCTEFDNGLSAAPAGFILETSALNSNGDRLKFNFETGSWVVSGSGTVLNTSSVYNNGRFSPFESLEVELGSLLSEGVNLNSQGAFDFILTVSAVGDYPCFVKSLRAESLAIPSSQQPKEVFKFTPSTNLSSTWVLPSSNQNLFSGFLINHAAFPVGINEGLGFQQWICARAVHAMNFSTESIHSKDTVYQFFISRAGTAGPGADEFVKIKGAYCTDATLSVVDEEIDPDTITSELYFRSPRRNIVGKPYMMMNSFSSLYGSFDYLAPVILGLNNHKEDIYWGRPEGLMFEHNANPGEEPNLLLSYGYALSDITMPVSSQGLAFSFKYNAISMNPPFVKWIANANTKQGKIVFWDATTSSWSEKGRGEETENDFAYTVSGNTAFGQNVKFNRTSVVDITNKDFDDSTVITFSLVVNDWIGAQRFWITDWQFYNVTASAMFDLGTFPEPDDTTVQPATLPAGRLGQFTNNIELNVTGITNERALGSANWASDSATSALASNSVGDITSTHNAGGCVNSEGFVYSGQGAAGYYFSGYTTSSNSTSIVHVIDLSGTDVNYFDLQGGIGAMGLWAFDVDKTFAKLLDNGYTLDSVYDTPGPSGKLYNVTDTDRNPVFKLLSKKVFRRPITIASGLSNPSLRIVWEIKFL